MSDYITTSSGRHFCPTRPDPKMLDINDIAHALSYICRGNGHVSSFFSVGQHCIHCAREAAARGCSDRVVMACLLHDASEAYMSDVPRPFKQYLGEYISWEDKLLDVIYARYMGTVPDETERKLIKQIDDDMLYYDLKILLKEDSGKTAPEMKTVFSYDVLPFEEVQRCYIEIYEHYAAKLQHNE